MHAPDINKVATIIQDVMATEILPRRNKLLASEVSVKSHADDLVTIADQAAETALTKALTGLLPGSKVLGEEAYAADKKILNLLNQDAPVWVLDPLDGTYAFVNGEDNFSTIVSLVYKGQVVAAWIWQPLSNDMTCAEANSGIEINNQRIKSIKTELDFNQMVGEICSEWPYFDTEKYKSFLSQFSGISANLYAGNCHRMIAEQTLHFVIHLPPFNPWDHFPGLVITKQLGGVIRRMDGVDYSVSMAADFIADRGFDSITLLAHSEEAWEKIKNGLIASRS